MRLLFWGTPDFATPPLRAIIGEGHDVVGVVTQPDRPHGRSRSALVPPPVKIVALEEGIPVLQPDRPRGDDFMLLADPNDLNPRMIIRWQAALARTPRVWGPWHAYAALPPKAFAAGLTVICVPVSEVSAAFRRS